MSEEWKVHKHISVLKYELVESLNLSAGQTAVDCTAGWGGHTEVMLEKLGPHGKVIAFDQDPWAISKLNERFSAAIKDKRLIVINAAFSSIAESLKDHSIDHISAIAADLGVSSPQLDSKTRGFSFMKEAPLHMRMDSDNAKDTAETIVNHLSEEELSDIFFTYGEEPKARFIARAIVAKRAEKPIKTTTELAEIIKGAIFYSKKSKKHPATKAFQGLRIYLNDELGELKKLIESGFSVLEKKGRMAIISFHSLEDRIIKQRFKALSGRGPKNEILKGLPLTEKEIASSDRSSGQIIKPFPLCPSEQEVSDNPRARSAKLRVIEKK